MYSYFESENAINLDTFSFEQWSAFVFDHEVTEPEWYREIDWMYTPTNFLSHCTRLFSEAGSLLDRYSREQLFQGFWLLLGEVDDWLWDSEVGSKSREDCIRSMVSVFKQLFVIDRLRFTCHMWWDCLRYFGDDPDPITLEAIFQACCEILAMPNPEVWDSALHGLGHLDHPGRRDAIEKFLVLHPELNDEMKRYAALCIEGTVL